VSPAVHAAFEIMTTALPLVTLWILMWRILNLNYWALSSSGGAGRWVTRQAPHYPT
jgi:hypothetical protein